MRTRLLPPHRGRDKRVTTDNPCVVCAKEVDPATARYVHLIDGGGVILHPGDEHLYVPDGGDVGGHPIGPDCAKRLGHEWSVPPTKMTLAEELQ